MIIDRKNYLKTVRVEFGKELGGDSPADAYFIMREPTTLEWAEIQEASAEKKESIIIKRLKDIFPALIIEHNIYSDKTTQYSNAEAVEIVFGKIDAALKVINDYIAEIKNPLMSKSGEK